MTTIELEYKTATEVRIHAPEGVMYELSGVFTFVVPGAKFMKKYKMGIWDGKIRMVNVRNGTTYLGLLKPIYEFCIDRGYKLKVDPIITEVFKEQISFNQDDLNLPFQLRDFQENSVEFALKKKRGLILSSTGSGKSLIIYAIVRAFQEHCDEGCGVIVVPSISLVEQLRTDFMGYSKDDEWDVDENVQRIRGGLDSEVTKPIVITTWQSLHKKPPEYFEPFHYLIADEVHTFQSTACQSIMTKAANADYRIGLTGALQGSKVDALMLKGLFGETFEATKTADLIERGALADLTIKSIVLQHNKETCDLAKKATYQEEMNLIVSDKKRNNFIKKLTESTKGNTLVLFQYVEKHGKVLYEMMKNSTNKDVHFVIGKTDVELREQVRQITENNTDVVILASYGVYQQGINIVNLDNIVFASPTKSKVRLFQSIGRGLRRSEDKTKCLVIDIVDDLAVGRKTKNHTFKHFLKRYDYYVKENFNVSIKKYNI